MTEVDRDPWTEAGYDPSLAFLLWAWGGADGFSNGKGSGSGSYAHRRGTVPLLLERIAQGNPWQADPTTGRAPVDWLWRLTRSTPHDFKTVLQACLTHPKAPDPATWSQRLVYDSVEPGQPGGQAPTLWINGIVSHPLGGDVAQLFASLGGRLDALDSSGNGLLSNCSSQPWSKIEQFMAAAESQGASIMDVPEGKSWLSCWGYQSPSDLTEHQAQFVKLAKKYPQACKSSVPPLEEMISVLRQSGGMRSTSAAWKRLDMDKHFREHPKDVVRLQAEVLSLANRVFNASVSSAQSSTLSYLSGRLVKLLDASNPEHRAGCQLASALSDMLKKGKDEFLLLAYSQDCLAPEGVPVADHLAGISSFLSNHWPTNTNHHADKLPVLIGGFSTVVLERLLEAQAVPPQRLREYLKGLTGQQAAGIRAWADSSNVVALLALDGQATPDPEMTEQLVIDCLGHFKIRQSSILTHMGQEILALAQGKSTTRFPSVALAAPHFCDVLPALAQGSPRVAHALEDVIRALSAQNHTAGYEYVSEVVSFLGQVALSARARVVQEQPPSSPRSRM